MARKNQARREQPRARSTLDRARDELFTAIRQCGVIDASVEEQSEWMSETVHFMAQRHPELTQQELSQLEETGLRFCQPVIPHGKDHSALKLEDANAA